MKFINANKNTQNTSGKNYNLSDSIQLPGNRPDGRTKISRPVQALWDRKPVDLVARVQNAVD
jgi:hypothetical protein